MASPVFSYGSTTTIDTNRISSAMPANSLQAFRFLDLPSEIRNKIYRNLLCTFRLSPTGISIGPPHDILRLRVAEHEIETNILRTNIQIHREAYDAMVKTNRFVIIKSAGGLLMHHIMAM